MTERLYYTDADRLTFTARIVDADESGRRVYLDRTAFYPTSGGQPHDTGVLDGVRVVDVVDEGERIAHLLEGPLASAVGDPVHGEIDADRRRDHMQQHTGQHVLSAVLSDMFGAETVSVHFGTAVSLVELDVPALTRDQIVAAERRANGIVAQARAVAISLVDAAEAKGLRKPSERTGILRVVTIADLDRSACGGTHVATTAEVGPILLRRAERIRHRLRVEFVCGGRAIDRARADFEMLAALGESMSTAASNLPTLIAAQGDRLRALEQERRLLVASAASGRARALHAEADAGSNGIRLVIERLRGDLGELHRQTAQASAELPRSAYIAADDVTGTIVFAASSDTGLDAGGILRAVVTAAGGRGGGSPRVAQGSIRDVGAMEQSVGALAQSVTG